MAYVIFDLDGTVIDSSHRHATKADGSLDLKHWLTNARPHLIMQDKLLPLARSWRNIYKAGHTVIVCTSRCMQEADRNFLAMHRLCYHHLFSRSGRIVYEDHPDFHSSYHGFIGDERSDEAIKAEQLEAFFRSEGFASAKEARAIMFDDNYKVINEMKRIGISCLDAKNVNYHIRVAA